MEREEKKGFIAGIISIIIMGFSFYFSKIALNELNNRVLDLLSYRFIFSSMGIILLWKLNIIKLDYKNKDIKKLILMCFIQPVAYFIFEVLGLSMISSSEAGLIMALMPIFNIVMGIVFLKERISIKQTLFIILSIGGAIFINVMAFEPGSSSTLGRVILLIAVVIGSTFSVLSRKLSNEFTSIERTAAMMLSGGVVFTIMASLENLYRGRYIEYIQGIFNIKLLIPLMFLGLCSSLIAMFLLNIAYSHLEVKKVSIIINGMIIVFLFAGVVLLKDNFYWYHLIGSLTILIGGIGASY